MFQQQCWGKEGRDGDTLPRFHVVDRQELPRVDARLVSVAFANAEWVNLFGVVACNVERQQRYTLHPITGTTASD